MRSYRAEDLRTPRVKLVPPRLPASHVRRPVLEQLLEEAERRRLTSIVAGPGFGKSTLAASVALERGWAWYRVDENDDSASVLGRGLGDALQLELAPELFSAADADALATAIAQSLDEKLLDDRVLVVDDVHEIGHAQEATRMLETLVRQGPPELHLLLCSREVLPFPIERLRGQGQVLDVDASMLSFSAEETARLIASDEPDLSSRIHTVTAGWPVAVQLSAALLDALSEDERARAVAELTTLRGPLFRYLAEEVLDRERPELIHLLQTAALFEIFSQDLCEALGIGDAVESLAELARRGFVSASSERGGFLRLHDLLRAFLRESRPLREPERIAALRTAAGWFEEQGLIAEALGAWVEIDDVNEISRLTHGHGWDLFYEGHADLIIASAERLPPMLLDGELKLNVALARWLRGEYDVARRSLQQLLESGGPQAAAAAFNLANYESQHGEIRRAVDLFLGPGREFPLSLAFASGAYLALGNLPEARSCAQRALLEADEEDLQMNPKAEAHLNLGEVCLAEGDLSAAAAEFEAAHEGTRRGKSVNIQCSARYRFGELELARGNYAEALAETVETLGFAERIGFKLFEVMSRKLRGETLLHLGHLDEAGADFAAAGFAPGLGDVHQERGELPQARAAYEAGVKEADWTGRLADRVRARAGMARVLVSEDAQAAKVAATEALELDILRQPLAHIALGWAAHAAGDRATALESALDAAEAARSKGDRPGMAESLELRALCSEPVDMAVLEEALGIWRELGAEVAAERVELALARLSGNRLGADRAERELRRLGVRATAARAAGILMAIGPAEPVPVAIQTLGGFRLVRDGTAVGTEAWKSKKARDLLKLLAGRRGRPVARDALIEALWPEEDPARTGNRLSVTLSTLRSVLDPEREFAQDHFVVAADGAVRLSLDTVELDLESFLETADAGLKAWRSDREDALPLLESAEAAYTGDFLEEDLYEEWAEPHRREYLAVYVEVLRALAEATGAPRYFLRIIERDRYDEQAHLGLVCALAGRGAHGEARRAYRTYQMEMQELGKEPVSYPELGAGSRARVEA